MDAIRAIMSRHSVRRYTDQTISEEQLAKILAAGTSGPSCVYAQDWEFIVVRDQCVLDKMVECCDAPAAPARRCSVCILICGNLERAFPPAKDYWIIDGAIAGENMVIAATSMGIGSVWLGVYPEMNRVENLQRCFELPEFIVPHSMIAMGYPDETEPRRPVKAIPDCIHYDRW